MPLRDLTCDECQHEFEALVRKGEEPTCPLCGSTKLSTRLSTFGVGGARPTLADARADGSCGSCGSLSGPGS
ncbi:MAG: zinc ribbon domain-containing protein [Planctomycetes bacterium]|nr:zinc ribbon domain-containing protein [Planctomycetota bacterium]